MVYSYGALNHFYFFTPKMWKRGKLAFVIFSSQVLLLVIFVLKGKYGNEANATHQSHNYAPALGGQDPKENSIGKEVTRLMDSFQMLFLVFGLSISYTNNYFMSGTGVNFLVTFIVIQVSLVCQLFHRNQVIVDVHQLKVSIQAGVASLISLLSLHGKLSSLQLITVSTIHTIVYEMTCNIVSNFHIHEITPGLKVIGFGSFFGFAVSVAFSSPESKRAYKLETSSRCQFFCIVSSVLSFVLWPSFLTGSSLGDKRHRIVLNVLLSMMGGIVSAFGVSSLSDDNNKFVAKVVFLGVTSGAVAVSSIAGLMLHPAGALLTGIFSSIVTCIAFYNLSPFLSRKLRLHDCFHVVPSFCLPIITSGILSSIYSLLADEKDYGVTLYEVFPARSPKSNSSELEEILWMLSRIEPGLGRTAGEQAVYQLIALSTIVSIALVSGVVSGVVIRHPMFDHLKKKEMFDDSGHWTTGNLEVVMTGGESNCELDNSNAGDQVETLQIPSLKRIRTKLNA